MSSDVKDEVRARREEMVSLRRDLHAHPETAFREERTSRLVAERLAAFGLEVSTGAAETGVTAVIDGAAPGPTLMLRADMDALPIQETSDRPYASRDTRRHARLRPRRPYGCASHRRRHSRRPQAEPQRPCPASIPACRGEHGRRNTHDRGGGHGRPACGPVCSDSTSGTACRWAR